MAISECLLRIISGCFKPVFYVESHKVALNIGLMRFYFRKMKNIFLIGLYRSEIRVTYFLLISKWMAFSRYLFFVD